MPSLDDLIDLEHATLIAAHDRPHQFTVAGMTDSGASYFGSNYLFEDGSFDNAFEVRDIVTNEVKRSTNLGRDAIGALALSPDQQRVGVQGWDEAGPFVRVFDFASKQLGEERRIQSQHSPIGWTGDGSALVIAPSGVEDTLFALSRDGARLPDIALTKLGDRMGFLTPAGPGQVLYSWHFSDSQFDLVDVARASAETHPWPAHVDRLAVRGDRLVASLRPWQVMLSSLPGKTVAWPSQDALDEARGPSLAALRERLEARAAVARSNFHKRETGDCLAATKKRRSFRVEGPLQFLPGISLTDGSQAPRGLALLDDDSVITAGSHEVTWLHSAGEHLREDVLVRTKPKQGLNVSLQWRSASGDVFALEVETKDFRQVAFFRPSAERAPEPAAKREKKPAKAAPKRAAPKKPTKKKR